MEKRIIFIFLSLVGFSINIMAQKWIVNEHEADALKKQKAYTSYRFEDINGNTFVYWSWSFKDGDFRIVSSSDIFNYKSNRFVEITVGFYDNQDNLVEDSKITIKVEENARYATVPYKKKTATKIIKYLNEQEGYVRIIAPLYGTTANFDIKVLCHKSCNNN